MANYPQTTTSAFTGDICVTDGGKVGIGTTSPELPLHVSKGDPGSSPGWNDNDIMVLSHNGNQNVVLQIYTDTDRRGVIGFSNVNTRNAGKITYAHDAGNGEMWFYTNGTQQLVIDDSGNVGIGTSSPASKLEVEGGDIEVDDSNRGLILHDSNYNRWRLTVDTSGTLNLTKL